MLHTASECMKCIQCLNLELVFTLITWVKILCFLNIAFIHVAYIPLQGGHHSSTYGWHYSHIAEEGKVLNGLYFWEIIKNSIHLVL